MVSVHRLAAGSPVAVFREEIEASATCVSRENSIRPFSHWSNHRESQVNLLQSRLLGVSEYRLRRAIRRRGNGRSCSIMCSMVHMVVGDEGKNRTPGVTTKKIGFHKCFHFGLKKLRIWGYQIAFVFFFLPAVNNIHNL
jgi:hypothetical protein